MVSKINTLKSSDFLYIIITGPSVPFWGASFSSERAPASVKKELHPHSSLYPLFSMKIHSSIVI